MFTLELNFLDKIGVILSSDNPQIINFVHNNLRYFEREENVKKRIIVNISKDKTEKKNEKLEKIGKNIYVSKTSLRYQDAKGNYVIDLNKDELKIKAYLGKYAIIKQWMLGTAYGKNLIAFKRARNETYLGLMRSIIHFPVFWMLEREGIFLIHAAAVEKSGYGIILFGLNDVGKSTIMQHLLKKGFKYVTDNYLLFDNKRIYPFPEAVGLEIGKNYYNLGKVMYETTIKKFVEIDENYISLETKGVIPKMAFLISRSENSDKDNLSAIENCLFYNLTFTFNDFLKEFHQYSYVNLLNLFDENDIQTQRINTHKKLSESVRCFKIINNDLDYTTNRIVEVFDNDIQSS